jgi:hypothetical protein
MSGPRDVLDAERDAMIGDLSADLVQRQDVAVPHVEVIPLVVLGDPGLDVVRGIDVEPAVEYVCSRVGGEHVGDDRLDW